MVSFFIFPVLCWCYLKLNHLYILQCIKSKQVGLQLINFHHKMFNIIDRLFKYNCWQIRQIALINIVPDLSSISGLQFHVVLWQQLLIPTLFVHICSEQQAWCSSASGAVMYIIEQLKVLEVQHSSCLNINKTFDQSRPDAFSIYSRYSREVRHGLRLQLNDTIVLNHSPINDHLSSVTDPVRFDRH